MTIPADNENTYQNPGTLEKVAKILDQLEIKKEKFRRDRIWSQLVKLMGTLDI